MTTTVKEIKEAVDEVEKDIQEPETAIVEPKKGFFEKVKGSKVGQFVARHKTGIATGLGTAVALAAAAVIGKKTGLFDDVAPELGPDVIDVEPLGQDAVE